jgi:hypothetical protein
MNETGGTVEVTGTINFKFAVRSEDCNVFSTEELIASIKEDGINWFIDHWLGSTNMMLSDLKDDDSLPEQPVPVVFASEDGEESYAIALEAKLVPGSKYVFLDESDELAPPTPCGDEEHPHVV